MEPKAQAAILITELAAGWLFGRVFIPYLRKIKTGKFDFCIGDRFSKDGSEPKFGGIVFALTMLIGTAMGLAVRTSSEQGLGKAYDLRIVLCVIMYAGILLAVGLNEDHQKETKSGIGMKPLYKWGTEFAASFGFLILIKMFGMDTENILLPFRLGYLSLGYAYYPIMALLMTISINFTEITDCPNGVTEKGCDGLCTLTVFLCAMGMTSALSVSQNGSAAGLFAVSAAGAAAALLFWSCCPSKLYPGQSGSLLMGGILSCIAVISGYHLIYVLSGIVFVIDGASAVLQRIVFCRSKKLLFKGASLHEHLKNTGWGEYRIMAVSAALSVLGGAAAAAFVLYAEKIEI